MLADMMTVTAIGVLVWIICLTLDKKLIGYLVILVTVFTLISMIAEKAGPVIQDWGQRKAKVEKFLDKL